MRHHFVYIYTNTLNQLHNLQKVYKLDINRSTAKQLPEGRFEVQGLLSDEEIERIRCDGYDVEFNEEDSEDNVRSQDEDENSEDEENGDNGDSSETGTEQENEQKNVCSGWAVCVNIAANAQDSGAAGAGLGALTASETPFQLATPF